MSAQAISDMIGVTQKGNLTEIAHFQHAISFPTQNT